VNAYVRTHVSHGTQKAEQGNKLTHAKALWASEVRHACFYYMCKRRKREARFMPFTSHTVAVVEASEAGQATAEKGV